MLEPLLGNKIKEQILLYLFVKKEIYARDVASSFGFYLLSVQNQLKKLERGQIIVSRLQGRTRLYNFNPRYPFKKELEVLLEKTLSFMPQSEKNKYFTPRLRPRRTGKPL